MKPNLVIVMGVSGCGKSTIAEAIASEYDYQFVEADDFHPPQNKQHMAAGKPLTDAMRGPWLELLTTQLQNAAQKKQDCVMSFSGLRRKHRALMHELPFEVLCLHLEGDAQLIRSRMQARENHFMPSSLLDSQYDALESTQNDPNTYSIDINQSLENVVADAFAIIRKADTLPLN